MWQPTGKRNNAAESCAGLQTIRVRAAWRRCAPHSAPLLAAAFRSRPPPPFWPHRKPSQYTEAEIAKLPASACPREWLSSEPSHPRRSLLAAPEHKHSPMAVAVTIACTLASLAGSLLLGAAFLRVLRQHAELAVHATIVLQVGAGCRVALGLLPRQLKRNMCVRVYVTALFTGGMILCPSADQLTHLCSNPHFTPLAPHLPPPDRWRCRLLAAQPACSPSWLAPGPTMLCLPPFRCWCLDSPASPSAGRPASRFRQPYGCCACQLTAWQQIRRSPGSRWHSAWRPWQLWRPCSGSLVSLAAIQFMLLALSAAQRCVCACGTGWLLPPLHRCSHRCALALQLSPLRPHPTCRRRHDAQRFACGQPFTAWQPRLPRQRWQAGALLRVHA